MHVSGSLYSAGSPWIVPDFQVRGCICEGAIKPTQTEHLLSARGLAVQPPIAPRRLACMVPRYRPHTRSRHTGSGRRLLTIQLRPDRKSALSRTADRLTSNRFCRDVSSVQ